MELQGGFSLWSKENDRRDTHHDHHLFARLQLPAHDAFHPTGPNALSSMFDVHAHESRDEKHGHR